MPPLTWRFRCPEGHCGWAPRSYGYYCKRCQERYTTLLDTKTDERTTIREAKSVPGLRS